MMRFAAIFCFAFFASGARAADVAVALTEDVVEVTTSFSGARLVLFGTVAGDEYTAENYDIISVVRGPSTQFEVRRLERNNLIWMPGDAVTINDAPGLYLTGATRAIEDIVLLPDQTAHGLGVDNIELDLLSAGDNSNETSAYKAAFLDEFEFLGLYKNIVGNVEYAKGRLFRINIDLPAQTPIGQYEVVVYLFQDGILVSQDSASLNVNKVGLERRIYELAHDRPISYGVLCVALSLIAGWAAGAVFRK
ncbi:MAG: TIGR02186 family protein [Marinicaulis sp.]|nr:TIGR02186 family protein [Marinicaulis sp.]NNL89157.1 TIGR02186 family protein [Marinicaulis sp.]